MTRQRETRTSKKRGETGNHTKDAKGGHRKRRGDMNEEDTDMQETQNVLGYDVDLNATLLTQWNVDMSEQQQKKMIEKIYEEELVATQFSASQILILEINQYLEKLLWPRYTTAASNAHTVSMVLMVNEKMRDRLEVWSVFNSDPDLFSHFFHQVLRMILDAPSTDDLTLVNHLLVFLTHCFGSLETPLIRRHCLKLTSLSIWCALEPSRLELELRQAPSVVRKHWRFLEKQQQQQQQTNTKEQDQKTDSAAVQLERRFLSDFLTMVIQQLYVFREADTLTPVQRLYLARVFELLIDLEAQLPTRRYFNVLLHDHQFLTHCRLSELFQPLSAASSSVLDVFIEPATRETYLLALLNLLQFYADFDVDDITGTAYTRQDITRRHAEKLVALQSKAFHDFPATLKNLALLPLCELEKRDVLLSHLQTLDDTALDALCASLGSRTMKTTLVIGHRSTAVSNHEQRRRLLLHHLLSLYQRPASPWQRIQSLPLYPDEHLLWQPALPFPLPLPKLNLQFLTLYDFLLRHFTLYRLETAYAVRQDMDEALRRMDIHAVDEYSDRPQLAAQGWSRMGLMVLGSQIIDVGPPSLLDEGYREMTMKDSVPMNDTDPSNLLYRELMSALTDHATVIDASVVLPHPKQQQQGTPRPSHVQMDVTVNVERVMAPLVSEWDALRPNDVLFLVSLQGKSSLAEEEQQHPEKETSSVAVEYRVTAVRGAMLEGFVKHGRVVDMNDEVQMKQVRSATTRVLRVRLDPAQYQRDQQQQQHDSEYHVVVRRSPEKNHFRATLEALYDLMRQDHAGASGSWLPAWLHDVFLGYGDPATVCADIWQWRENRENPSEETPSEPRVYDMVDTFVDAQHWQSIVGDVHDKGDEIGETVNVKLRVERDVVRKNRAFLPGCRVTLLPYQVSSNGDVAAAPVRKRNPVRFTARQVEAIVAGMSPGLTLIVGPPGTGKTDVAVQLVSNLYHHAPQEHILLLTHSNQALNDLFEKIMVRDVDERHLLRLGHGEEALRTDKDFSKLGRVDALLERRAQLLLRVQQLSASLSIPGDHGATCETALHFYASFVTPLWEKYNAVQGEGRVFPFMVFFQGEDTERQSSQSDWEQQCFASLQRLFDELNDLRALELLPRDKERNRYLLTKQARIVAMTVTYAALKRRELIESRFHYDTIIMEEAAQILEIETFLPWLLSMQGSDKTSHAVKRIVLIGDHHQLPPVVQCRPLTRFANLEQSLFRRLVRLGVPTIRLDAQGRARESLARLYAWRYDGLENLKIDALGPLTNAGLLYDHQFIDVRGGEESSPVSHFYQNLEEAEWMVSLYMYMLLQGYPAERIALLTTYNGQRHLLRDIVQARCRRHGLPAPGAISTVDKFQGQQRDYVLLSLVRTRHVGHIRDVRRWVVALSRARLGLYVFGNAALFSKCYELQTVMTMLKERPLSLRLVEGETYGGNAVREKAPSTVEIQSADEMARYLERLKKSLALQDEGSSPEQEMEEDEEDDDEDEEEDDDDE